MTELMSKLESLMPGRIAKVILVLTFVTVGGLLLNTPDLPNVQPPLSKTQTLAIQIWQSLSVMVLGLLALLASSIYAFQKAQSQLHSLHRALIEIMRIVTEETTHVKGRLSLIKSKSPNTYTKETVDEITSLADYRYSIEKISAIILRYLDTNDAKLQALKDAASSDSPTQ